MQFFHIYQILPFLKQLLSFDFGCGFINAVECSFFERFGGMILHSFCLFYKFYSTYSTYIYSITITHQYIHPSPFAEVPLHFLIAGYLSGKNLPGVTSRE
jgi:hypothetical protein